MRMLHDVDLEWKGEGATTDRQCETNQVRWIHVIVVRRIVENDAFELVGKSDAVRARVKLEKESQESIYAQDHDVMPFE